MPHPVASEEERQRWKQQGSAEVVNVADKTFEESTLGAR